MEGGGGGESKIHYTTLIFLLHIKMFILSLKLKC